MVHTWFKLTLQNIIQSWIALLVFHSCLLGFYSFPDIADCYENMLYWCESDFSSFLVYVGLPGEKGERGSPGTGVRGQRGANGPPGNTVFMGETAQIFSWTLFSSSCRQSAGLPLFSYSFIFTLKHSFTVTASSAFLWTFTGTQSTPVGPLKMTHSSQRPKFTYSIRVSGTFVWAAALHKLFGGTPNIFFPSLKIYVWCILSFSKHCAHLKYYTVNGRYLHSSLGTEFLCLEFRQSRSWCSFRNNCLKRLLGWFVSLKKAIAFPLSNI